MGEAIQFLFEDCGGHPVPRLDRTKDGTVRRADGVVYFDLTSGPEYFGMKGGELRTLWTDFFSDLAGRGEAEDLTAAPATPDAADARRDALHRLRFPHLSAEHFAAFMAQCEERRLNPFANEIGADLRHDKRSGLPRLYIFYPMAGLRTLAHRSKNYVGIRAPKHFYGEDPHRPSRTTLIVRKLVKGACRSFEGVAEWSESAPPPGRDDFWDSKPKTAMAMRAEKDALCKAFRRLNNLYLPEELPDGPGERRVDPVEPMSAMPRRAKLAGIGAPSTEIEAHSEFVALGFTDPRQVAKIIEGLKERFAEIWEQSPATFWSLAVQTVKRDPAGVRRALG